MVTDDPEHKKNLKNALAGAFAENGKCLPFNEHFIELQYIAFRVEHQFQYGLFFQKKNTL